MTRPRDNIEKTNNILAWNLAGHEWLNEPLKRWTFSLAANNSTSLPPFLRPQHCFVCGEPLSEADQSKLLKGQSKTTCNTQKRSFCDNTGRDLIYADIRKALQGEWSSPQEVEMANFAAYRHIAHLLQRVPYQPAYLLDYFDASIDWYSLGLLGFELGGLPDFIKPSIQGKRLSLYDRDSERFIWLEDLKDKYQGRK